MYKNLSILAFVLIASPSFAEEVTLRNFSCVFANQGMFSSAFVASGVNLDNDIDNLKIKVRLLNGKTKKVIQNDVLEFESLSSAGANRYSNAFLEGENVCGDGDILEVMSATAVRNGKRINIKIVPELFNPARIVVKKG